MAEIVDYIKLATEFNALPDDAARWRWVKDHQHLDIIVICDNDATYIVFPDDQTTANVGGDPGPCIEAEFDEFIGWADGVFSLLDAFGICAESA